MKKYTIEVREDYAENTGNPINVETHTFDTLQEAESKMDSELEGKSLEYGLTTTVTLYESNETGKDMLYNDLCSADLPSKALPPDGVVVYYHHDTYMGYCYVIEKVEKVADAYNYITRQSLATHADLPYGEDRTGRTHVKVYEDIAELESSYMSGVGAPFNKLKKGGRIVEDFLAENESLLEN